ncbi:MAG TPA: ABC transporter ATP-binding protein [Alphaproteobacteria bacterium]|nr:ABC transporter ATP-binding protein [Alphaproteobacteria bacterium]
MSDAPVRLEKIAKHFGGVTALENVNLTIEPGEFIALAGHNGAGKTTLFKIILGLVRPSSGAVSVFGAPPQSKRAVGLRSAIGFLPENVTFAGNLTGIELLRYYARLKRVPLGQCTDLLDQVGLGDAVRRQVRTYSKGMRQRLGLAQMLLGEPKLLVLDEPTSGLDPDARRQFRSLLEERRRAGATILLSSHALVDFEEAADRIAFLREGRVVACGTIDELRRASALPVRIRVRAGPDAHAALAKAVGDMADVRPVNGQSVELSCAADKHIAILRRVGELEAVDTVEVRPPHLEDIYAHYRNPGDRDADGDDGDREGETTP